MFIKYLSINPVIHAHITRSLYFAVVYMNQGLAVNATTLSHASSLLFIFSVFASDRRGSYIAPRSFRARATRWAEPGLWKFFWCVIMPRS